MYHQNWWFSEFHPPLDANVLFCRFFLNLTLCMTKLRVLVLRLSVFTDNSTMWINRTDLAKNKNKRIIWKQHVLAHSNYCVTSDMVYFFLFFHLRRHLHTLMCTHDPWDPQYIHWGNVSRQTLVVTLRFIQWRKISLPNRPYHDANGFTPPYGKFKRATMAKIKKFARQSSQENEQLK